MKVNNLFKNITFLTLIAGSISFVSAYLIQEFGFKEIVLSSSFFEIIILLKEVFLQLLKMMIGPIVFFSIIGGIISIGNKEKLQTTGKIAFAYYLTTTFIAILIGLFVVLFIHPWENYSPLIKENSQISKQKISESKNYNLNKSKIKKVQKESDSFINVIKKFTSKCFVNPFSALTNLNILGIVFNAFLFGCALILTSKRSDHIKHIINDINQVINKILSWIIKFSPIGVFAIIFEFKLKLNSNIFEVLISFSLVVVMATLVHGVIILPGITYLITKIKPKDLFPKLMKPILIAFSTSSSSATLPVSLEVCDNELKIDRGVSGFILPLGATMNMDGTALFEGIAAVFLAYMYGVDITGLSIFSIFLMAMVSSIGAPGMPSGSMAGMQIVLLSIGVPLEGIAILLIVEKPLDTIRTAVNVEGNLIGALITQRIIDNKNKK
jgi:Na+/H+-dicarboxylate symporter